ncbi:hypothetical protein Esti_001287 [Eimeria stiedai]
MVTGPLSSLTCWCLSRIASHTVDFAEAVVEAEALPKTLHCLKDPDDTVRRSGAACVREIVKHTPQLAAFAANAGAIPALVSLIQESTGATRVTGILALGYIGAFTETLALAVIVQKGIPPLKQALETEPEDHAKAAAAWALGQLGRHTPDHAAAVAEADILRLYAAILTASSASPRMRFMVRQVSLCKVVMLETTSRLMTLLLAPDSSEDLKNKAKRAVKSVVQICTHLEALEPLLNDAPPSILKCIVQQFAKVLPNDPKARRTFVQTGALETLLRIRETEAASEVLDSIQSVCTLYPPEVVNYYSPGYSGTKQSSLTLFLRAVAASMIIRSQVGRPIPSLSIFRNNSDRQDRRPRMIYSQYTFRLEVRFLHNAAQSSLRARKKLHSLLDGVGETTFYALPCHDRGPLSLFCRELLLRMGLGSHGRPQWRVREAPEPSQTFDADTK